MQEVQNSWVLPISGRYQGPVQGAMLINAEDPWLHSYSGKSVRFVLLMDVFDNKQKQLWGFGFISMSVTRACPTLKLQGNVELLPLLQRLTEPGWLFTSHHFVAYMGMFSPLSVTKKVDIVNIAAPSLVEKRCSSSSCMSAPFSLHSALVLGPKPSSLGGGPHVTFTLLPKNTSGGSKCKGVRSSNRKRHISTARASP